MWVAGLLNGPYLGSNFGPVEAAWVKPVGVSTGPKIGPKIVWALDPIKIQIQIQIKMEIQIQIKYVTMDNNKIKINAG